MLVFVLLQPFLKLTAEQLEKLVPLLSRIPTNKLAGIFQLLAGLPDQTTTNLLTLLSLVSSTYNASHTMWPLDHRHYLVPRIFCCNQTQ
jgi:hypothetical protein